MERYLYQDLYQLERTHFWHISKRQTVLALLKRYLHLPAKILDYGCGTGENVKALSALGESFGIDISKEAVEFCKKRGLKNVILVKDGKIPFKNGSFDVVTMLDVLEHVEEKSSLAKVQRVLKKDGLVIVSVPAYQWLWSRWDEVLHHKKRYTQSQLAKVLENNGFQILYSSYAYSFLLLPILITRFIKGLFSSKHYSSDFKLSSPVINQLMLIIANIERLFITTSGIPFGTSIICVAKKR